MNRLALLSCAAALSAALACGSTSSETTVGPTPVRCGVTVTNSPAMLPHGGGSGTVAVSAARECSWSASTSTSWITLLNPSEGQGDGSVKYTVGRNPAARTRRGTLTVNGRSAEVAQQAAPCTFELDRRAFDIASTGGSGRVGVRTPDGCSWEAASAAPWIDIAEGVRGEGSGEVRFDVDANTAPAARTGRLTIANIEVTVRQAAPGAAPPPEPGDCTFAVEPASAEIGPAQTQDTLAVVTQAACGWTATSDASWLQVVSDASGTGAGTVTYRAEENREPVGRTGRITVQGAVFTVVQEGRLPGCEYAIDPTSASFDSGGGSGEIEVQTSFLCTWSAASQAAWIRITSGSGGIGDGEVDYTVEANPGAARSGTILVAGRTFTVTQSANVTTITGDVENLAGSCPHTTFTVQDQPVRTNSATSFTRGSCQNRLREGRRVRVTGPVGSDGVLTASEVRF
ncbi:MAG TPA: BACON domain-containing carbohydrate-binding protein [Vicinamibacterales bacterium]|nr:BACON domain-containing carbohydrate-binding protein [Vicinamibacterales bacterium]